MNHDDLGNYSHATVRALREKITAVENLISHSEQFGDGKVSITDLCAVLQASTQPVYAQLHEFQTRVKPWMSACFGDEISSDTIERNHRFLEESLELVQACGCTLSEAHQLVDYVFNRPVGEPHQEVGGVMVTLAALCLANKLNMHEAGETELARIWTKVEKIRAKQAAKPKHSPLPETVIYKQEASEQELADLAMRHGLRGVWDAAKAKHSTLPEAPKQVEKDSLKEENEHLRAGIDLYIRDAKRYQVKKRIDWAKAEEQPIYSTASELEKEIMRSVWNLTYDSVIDDAINEMLAKKKG